MKSLQTMAIGAFALLISGCIEFRSVDQPISEPVNVMFTVNIESYTDGGSYSPYFGVCLPVGWSVPGDSVICTGMYNETIYYDSTVSNNQENASPAPEGCYWWAGSGPSGDTPEGTVHGEFRIQNDDQVGCFSLDYMLGNSFNGVNYERSDGHLIWVVDDYTPSRLRAVEGDNSVILSWHPPQDTVGLIGFNIFRDQEMISTGPVVETTYVDEDPLFGMHHYSLSSLYGEGDEHLTPYEIPLFYGGYAYISPDGDDSNDGSSFDDAFLTIAYALSVIRPDSLHPKTILLATGVYSPDSTGEEFPIRFVNYLSLTGAGPQASILDADYQSDVVEFVDIRNASVSGLTLTNGGNVGIRCDRSDPNIDNVLISENSGGGIYCVRSDAIINNCNISANSGMGIGCYEYSNPIISNNIISGNSWDGITCEASAPVIYNNTISGNSTGGIECAYSDVIIRGNTISENTTTEEGGGIYCQSSNASIRENIISGNSASSGGGIECREGPDAIAIIKNNTITGNSASNAGGGINCGWYSRPVISNNTIVNNSARWGGGINWGTGSNPGITGNIIIGNSAAYNGGGLRCVGVDSTTAIINNAVSGNSAQWGGGISCIINATPLISNNIFWADSAGGGPEIYVDDQSLPVIIYCDVQGGWEGEGNIDVDPLFRDPDNGDFHLMFTECGDSYDSPCIDAGSPAIIDTLLSCSWGLGTISSDMGAYGGGESIQVGIEGRDANVPRQFTLNQNYPNPFNASTTISYSLPEPGEVTVSVYNLLGQRVATLLEGTQEAGEYNVVWDAVNQASGLYFYRIQAGDYAETRKMMLLK